MENLTDNNKLIAEFMGAFIEGNGFMYFPSEGRHHRLTEIKYHSSWDWLMPVVEKCVNFCVDKNHDEWTGHILDSLSHFDKHELCSVLTEFMNWYNLNKQDHA